MTKESKNQRELQVLLFAAELSERCPILDLHGSRGRDVIAPLDAFLQEEKKSSDYVRIVYGIGEGVLATKVKSHLEKLQKEGAVWGYKQEQSGGSCVVVFRKQ